jgi:hypothetical protein
MDKNSILTAIIERGGVMGSIAKFYINDEEKSDKFIKECYAQCHNTGAKNLWGEKIVSEIETYVSNSVINHSNS